MRGDDGRERLLLALPSRAWDGALMRSSAAPELGADSDDVLRNILGLSSSEVAALREAGALA